MVTTGNPHLPLKLKVKLPDPVNAWMVVLIGSPYAFLIVLAEEYASPLTHGPW